MTPSKKTHLPASSGLEPMFEMEEDENRLEDITTDRAEQEYKLLNADEAVDFLRGAAVIVESDPLESAVETFTDRCFTEAENLGWHKSYDKLKRDVQNGQALEDFAPRTEEDIANWISSKMLLIAGEVCEAQEELRNGRGTLEVYYRDENGYYIDQPLNATYDEQVFVEGIPQLKPEGWLVEMADALIRLGDLVGTVAGQEGVFFGPIVAAKLQYNATRGVMHGGKKF